MFRLRGRGSSTYELTLRSQSKAWTTAETGSWPRPVPPPHPLCILTPSIRTTLPGHLPPPPHTYFLPFGFDSYSPFSLRYRPSPPSLP